MKKVNLFNELIKEREKTINSKELNAIIKNIWSKEDYKKDHIIKSLNKRNNSKFNNLKFIVDNGTRKFSQINFIDNNMTQIIGTETFVEYEKLHKSNFKNFILSLDIKDGNVLCRNSPIFF